MSDKWEVVTRRDDGYATFEIEANHIEVENGFVFFVDAHIPWSHGVLAAFPQDRVESIIRLAEEGSDA